MEITLDEGFLFGLGAFETIAIEHGKPVFLEEHLKRLEKAARFLGIQTLSERNIKKEEIICHIQAHCKEHSVLKIILSKENFLLQTRENPYQQKHYEKGFQMDFSEVRRNETSPFVYHKTMNYGDCIVEKRNAALAGMDERIFLNTKGEISEGTVSNIFFIKNEKIYTPEKSCGFLPGILRKYICKEYAVTEIKIMPQDISEYDECFVTNSLMGIMPVRQLGTHKFAQTTIAKRMNQEYRKKISNFYEYEVFILHN